MLPERRTYKWDETFTALMREFKHLPREDRSFLQHYIYLDIVYLSHDEKKRFLEELFLDLDAVPRRYLGKFGAKCDTLQ